MNYGIMRESKEKKKKRAQEVIRRLKKYYPDAHCALDHSTPEELLIATILSAQCTDERVNIVTKTLFKKYPSLQAFANADISELEQDVKPTGFYKNKAKNIKACAQRLISEFEGELPKTVEEMTSLAGVGRKTANVVLGNSFNISSGVVVDTHVRRLSQRLGFTKKDNPVLIEKELCDLIEKKHWIMFSHWLIYHGRQVCKARKPQCPTCFLDDICPSYRE